MYSTLGLIAASTGALFGNAMTSTPVLVGVSLVFFAMGASMLGAFDLAVPSGLQGKLQSGPRGGIIGAIFMGMVTGIVASPCVGPVLVVLLTWVAQHGTPLYGFSLLFVFACGLGLLFIVIGTFAGALNALPQAGQWMDTVKHVFGVILFAMGIYYAKTLIGPDLSWMATGLLVLMTGTFYGAFRPIPEDAEHGVLMRKGFGIAMVLCGGFALLVGLAGYSGVQLAGGGSLAGAGAGGLAEAHPGLDWVMTDDEGWATARAENKPVVMDFYADWCAACKELDHQTWVDPAVQAEADRFVAVKFDFTENTDWAKAKKAEYGIAGLPTVIFFDSQGNEVERFFGFRDAESVLGSMKAVN
jgi:thiol:disulfide interchange protein DsbD